MKAGPFPRVAPVNPAFTFLLLGLLPVLLQKTPLLLAKSVGQAKTCDEELHINGLFCQLVVLTLQRCCVPCASRQANQWLLTVTHPTPEKTAPFVYLCCVMSILNFNSLLSNILNYWRVLRLYIWCTFHWPKLWSLQIWGWNWSSCCEEDYGVVEDLERAVKTNWWRNSVLAETRGSAPRGKRMYAGNVLDLESFTFEWRGWRLKFRLTVKAPDCVSVVSTLVYVI